MVASGLQRDASRTFQTGGTGLGATRDRPPVGRQWRPALDHLLAGPRPFREGGSAASDSGRYTDGPVPLSGLRRHCQPDHDACCYVCVMARIRTGAHAVDAITGDVRADRGREERMNRNAVSNVPSSVISPPSITDRGRYFMTRLCLPRSTTTPRIIPSAS